MFQSVPLYKSYDRLVISQPVTRQTNLRLKFPSVKFQLGQSVG